MAPSPPGGFAAVSLTFRAWVIYPLTGRIRNDRPGVTQQASFLAWLDCRDLGLGDPAAVFPDKGRVALGHGPDFGAEGHVFARLNMGTSPELLGEAVRRAASAL